MGFERSFVTGPTLHHPDRPSLLAAAACDVGKVMRASTPLFRISISSTDQRRPRRPRCGDAFGVTYCYLLLRTSAIWRARLPLTEHPSPFSARPDHHEPFALSLSKGVVKVRCFDKLSTNGVVGGVGQPSLIGEPLSAPAQSSAGGSHSSTRLPSGSCSRAKRPVSGVSQAGSVVTAIPACARPASSASMSVTR